MRCADQYLLRDLITGEETLMNTDPSAAAERIARISTTLDKLREEIAKVIVGQRMIVDRMLMALIADGHILLEGVPGLAKGGFRA